MRALLQTLLLCLIITQLHAQCQEQDYIALRALYLNTDGDNWTDKTGWMTEADFIANPTMPAGTDVNTWYGVTTNVEGCITQLNLAANELSGSIPPEIGDLANLTSIFLYNNELSGNIPPEIGNLTNLIQLRLNGNQLSGTIPIEIGNLSNLELLYLRGNNLSGSIPAEIGNLINLTNLSLRANEFSGSIPPEIWNLINLQSFSIDNNQLTGSIPPEIGNLVNLISLYFYNNEFSGNIPPEIGNLTNLIQLRLNGNQFSGTIPIEIGNLSSLELLYLFENNLSGSIPAEIGNLSNLIKLNLGTNEFSGSIPTEIGDLSNLTSLTLINNQLSGSIPPEIGNLTNLTVLGLYANQLSGSIPPEFENLSNLTFLFLHNNNLSGCYDAALMSLCTQLDEDSNTNAKISDGNNFDAPWEDFCTMTIGVCNPFEYAQTDATLVMQALEVDDVANETHFEVHLNSNTSISAYAISVIINVDTIIDPNDIEINIDDSALSPDAYHIYVDDIGNIHITLARTDKIDQVIGDSICKIVIRDDILPLTINGGYTMSSIVELTAIGGSALYGSLDAPISLGLNHAYCDYKGTAEIYVEDASNYSYEWSTGETTLLVGDLDVGSYTVTVSDGMGDTTVIDFDIDWAFTPLNILVNNKKKRIYIDFEEGPLSEEVEISFNGGLIYRQPITNDTNYYLGDGTYPIWIRRMADECPTYMGDFTIDNPMRPDPDFSEYLINPSGVTARLNYELEQHGTVDISLYNIHGQRLRTLHHARSDTGTYQIEIDKGNLPKGIYFIHVMFISADGTTIYKTLKLLI